MIRSFAFPHGLNALALFRADTGIKQHPKYQRAKAGAPDEALSLVPQLAGQWLLDHEKRFEPNAIFVAPHAKELSGDNAIPQTLAAFCASAFLGVVDREIVQTDRFNHTGADAMERMASRATFEGAVVHGGRYVLVNDVTSLGGTLAELSNYIQCQGGCVVDVVVLVNGGRNPALLPVTNDIRLIKERFHHEIIETFGIATNALTANEARYLVGFRSVDEIINRLAAAKQEIDRRLRSKGVSRSGILAAGVQVAGKLSGHDSPDTPFSSS